MVAETDPGRRINIFSRSGHLGGMEFRVLDEARWLNDHGWDATAYFTPFPEWQRLVELGRDREVPVRQLPMPMFMEHWRWRHARMLHAHLTASRFRQRLQAEVAHVPFAWTDQGLSPLWLGARVAERVVISVHNVFPASRMSDWQRVRMKESFQKVVGIYGVSPAATDAFMDIFGEVTRSDTVLATVPNYVDVERFRPSEEKRASARAQLGVDEGACVIAALGRISKQKRPEMLIDIFAETVALAPDRDLRLLLIGGGELEEAVQGRAAERGIQDRVIVTGFVSRPEDYLAAADLDVLVGVREGCPLAALEAMAAGLPVVLADVPGSRSVLNGKEGCVFVPRDDVRVIAQNLADLVSDREGLRNRGKRAREEAVAEFSRPVWEQRLGDFYARSLDALKENRA